MNSRDKLFSIFSEILKIDKEAVATIVFGSFVSGNPLPKSYREVRIFDGSEYISSEFILKDIVSDIDMVFVTNNPQKTVSIINEIHPVIDQNFITINVMSQKIFENEALSRSPSALKRILLYRELLILYGEDYINSLQFQVKEQETESDLIFQKEFDLRKEYLQRHAKENIRQFTLSREEHEKMFPNFLKFIVGKLQAGFPKDRIKLVYPQPMELKAIVDRSSGIVREID